MGEPTLKDVLDAIAKLATKEELAKLDAKVDSHHAETTTRLKRLEKRLDEVDDDVNAHMKVHRELEKDIEALKRRTPRTAARPSRRR